jgi:hypothetical protein
LTPKQVITLSPSEFQDEARLLLQRIQEDFRPDLLIGIASGGLRVAQAMHGGEGPEILACRLRRPNTERKKFFAWLLRCLPYTMTDRLRRLEDRRASAEPLRAAEATEDLLLDLDRIAKRAASIGAVRIVVVDDAVDSGATLQCVVRELQSCVHESTQIRSAVLTRTRDNSLILPDYKLHQGVLFRFPWSFDYRARK